MMLSSAVLDVSDRVATWPPAGPPWIRVSHISVVVPGKNASSLLETVMLPVRTIYTRSLVDHSSMQHHFSKVKVQFDLDVSKVG